MVSPILYENMLFINISLGVYFFKTASIEVTSIISSPFASLVNTFNFFASSDLSFASR